MKLAIQQLEQHVTKSLAPVYLISGDEILLVQEAVDRLRKSAQQKGFSERVRVGMESSTDWGKFLYEQANSLSLFAEKRILELDLQSVKLTQANTQLLQTYVENPDQNTLLLI